MEVWIKLLTYPVVIMCVNSKARVNTLGEYFAENAYV